VHEDRIHTHLRLVWSRPETAYRRPPLRIDLARAIERHLSGADGLSDEQFVVLHATGRPAFKIARPQ
jgi:hypothetical protein